MRSKWEVLVKEGERNVVLGKKYLSLEKVLRVAKFKEPKVAPYLVVDWVFFVFAREV